MDRRAQLGWLCAVSLCYYAATTIGDTVAQSIFVSRLGVGALPSIFLIKAGIDVLSGFFYLPLTRGRSAGSVWRSLLILYVVVVALGWWASTFTNGELGAYILYGGHEVVWTLAVIHWGIFLLESSDPAASRRLFPILFGMGRLGALVGGALVGSLAIPLGATSLLGLAILLALFSAVASTKIVAASAADSSGGTMERRAALASPLVRLIALSTMTMVLLRYGLRMVSLDEIRTAFAHDKDQVAAFLGLFSVVGNAIAFVLGLYVVPKLLARLSVGAANLAYASTTLVAFLLTWLLPSLATASAARFVEMPLKHALKTPLSVLFYGAERPRTRIAARSLIFGIAIPVATVVAGLSFRSLRSHIGLISLLGIVLALLYLGICWWQNRCYRQRLAHRLREQLHTLEVPSKDQEAWLEQLQTIAPGLSPETKTLVATAFSANRPPLRSLAFTLLSEQLPHHLAQAIEHARLPLDGS